MTSSTMTDAKVTVAAAAIVDIWMGGDQTWRAKLSDSDFLESADWQRACEEARAVLDALEQSDAVMGEAEFNPLTDRLSEAESNRVERAMTTPIAPVQDDGR